MDGYRPETYGDRVANVYDAWHGSAPAEMIDLLASLSGSGSVVELAVGTGRVAIPLADRGIAVHGVDVSPAMVEHLRSKPGGDQIDVTLGDMVDVPVEGPFSLIFVVFNSFFGLQTQDDQVRCFANVADRPRPGGRFLLECFVPDPTLFDRGQRVSTSGLEVDELRLNATRHRRAAQRLDNQQVLITSAGTHFVPGRLRYAWPSELDLMARLAGLRLRARWAGWHQEPFDDNSNTHVTVYEKPEVAT